jgi:hypothetical protein
MYSAYPYQVAQARVADLHRQAAHDAQLREARKSRRAQRSPGHRVPALPAIAVRRVLTAWGVHA